ncbi:MAG: hypothetical protein ACYSVY_06445 [Planctomycetota bacterium]|jgi:hypothetical protein
MTSLEGMSEQDTGGSIPRSTIVTVNFDRFAIKVKLAADGRFLEIVEVAVSKDFRSSQQKRASHGFHDVADLYES